MKKKNLTLITTYFLFNIIYAQTGPGGVLNSTNTSFWIKADSYVYTDVGLTLATNGQSIAQWNDNSGNNKNFGENSVGQQPTFVTNAINGFPVARFDGNNDRLSNLTITSGNTANIFAVVKYTSLPSSNPGIFQGSPTGLLLSTGAADKSVGMWVSNANQPWGRGIQSNNTSINIPTSITTSVNNNYIIENQYNGSAINQYVNLATSGSITYNGTLKSWTEFSIGRQGGETWAGDIAEVIAFNTSINLAQRNIVSNYLSSKYNITISAASDFYAGDTGANGNYDFEVAGIGQASDGTTNLVFNPSVTGGLGLTYASGFDNGDYIFVGHNLISGNNSTNSDVAGMTGIQNQRWIRIWYIDVTNTATSIVTSVKFDMSDGGLAGIIPNNGENYVLLRRGSTTGSWTEYATGANVSGDEITFNNITLIDGYYTIGTKNASSSPLPIELLDFSATCATNGVLLNWSTASEIENDYFIIERSEDGITWNSVGKVDGNGTSTEVHKYVHEDLISTDKVFYYRLVQFDFNGKNRTHKIVDANCGVKVKDELLLYPNPSSTELNALFTMNKAVSGAELKIMNMSGQIVLDTKIDLNEGLNTFTFPIDFNSGTYQVVVATGDVFIPSQKIIVIKP